MRPGSDVFEAFGLCGTAEPLFGGENRSVRVGGAVLKPVEDISLAEWQLGVIDQIYPAGYRLSKPMRTRHGSFTYNGWSATRYEKGEHRLGHVGSKLLVSRRLHADLRHIPFDKMPEPKHRWARAHRIAWQQEALPRDISGQAYRVLGSLLESVGPCNCEKQIVHSDLSGNILFDETLGPLVIDFSPAVAPVEYAEAILVCDCIAWEGSPVSELGLLPATEYYREMIVRAVIFRLAVAALFSGDTSEAFLSELRAFKPVIDYTRPGA